MSAKIDSPQWTKILNPGAAIDGKQQQIEPEGVSAVIKHFQDAGANIRQEQKNLKEQQLEESKKS